MAKTKAVISFAVTAKLICVFVFANAKIRFAHVAAQIMVFYLSDCIHLFFLFFFGGGGVPACMLYRKVTKLWDARNLCCNLHVPKIREKRQSLWVFRPIHAN